MDFVNQDLKQIADFASDNMLKVDLSKSVVLLFGALRTMDSNKSALTFRIAVSNLLLSDSARNLEILMDNNFRFKTHISSVLRTAD